MYCTLLYSTLLLCYTMLYSTYIHTHTHLFIDLILSSPITFLTPGAQDDIARVSIVPRHPTAGFLVGDNRRYVRIHVLPQAPDSIIIRNMIDMFLVQFYYFEFFVLLSLPSFFSPFLPLFSIPTH